MTKLERAASIGLLVVPVIAVAGAASWFFRAQVAGSDLWWHLASGRDIWSRGGVPRTDPFSYTFQGEIWSNHEWLWDVLYWGAYRINPQLVAWLNVGILVAIFALCYVVAREVSGSRLAASVSICLTAAGAHWFLDIRPHLVTLLLMGIVFVTRDRPWAPWLWPGLTVLWANLHAGFVFGLGVIGLLVLIRTLQVSWRERRPVFLKRQWLGVALSLLAWIINPWGWRIIEYPLAYLESDTLYRNLIEWQSPPFGLDPLTYEGRFWLLAGVAVLGFLLVGRRRPYLAAMAVITFSMAMTARRFIPLFLIVSTPFVASVIARIQEWLVDGHAALRAPTPRLIATALGLATVLVLWQSVRVWPHPLERWTSSGYYPRAALHYMASLMPSGRVLNYYNWGGYIMLHAPQFQVFIDGRANTLYDEAIYNDYLRFLRGQPTPEILRVYPAADVALLPPGRYATALTRFEEPWTVVYRDQRAVVLLPPYSPLLGQRLPELETVLADEPELWLMAADRAIATRDTGPAREFAQKAVEADPLLIHGYGTLAKVHAMEGDLEAADRVIDDAAREYPRQEERLRQMQASAYMTAGDLKRAVPLLKQALPMGPFGRRARRIAYIERVEKRSRQSPGKRRR